MPLACEYCGLNLWTEQDLASHPVPCRPGVAPGSSTVGVGPGETAAPVPIPNEPGPLAPDTAEVGFLTTAE